MLNKLGKYDCLHLFVFDTLVVCNFDMSIDFRVCLLLRSLNE